LENGQSQLFDNIQNLFVKERFINQINSLIPKFKDYVNDVGIELFKVMFSLRHRPEYAR